MKKRTRPQSSTLSPLSVLAIIGFCGYIFWELLGIFGNLTFVSRFFPKELAQFFSLFEFFILASAFIVASRMHRRLEERFNVVIGIGILCAVLTLAISLIAYLLPLDSIPTFVWGALWGCHGLSLAGLMFAWALFFSKIFNGSTSRVISIGYAVGYLLFCLYSIADPNDNGAMPLLVAGIVSSLTIILLISCYFSHEEPSKPEGEEEESIPSTLDDINLAVSTSEKSFAWSKFPRTIYALSFGLSYGFAVYLVNSFGSNAITIGALGGFAGCILAFFVLPHNLLSSDTTVRRLSFIPVAIPLLLLPTGGAATCIICCMLIIASSSFTAVTSWVSTICKSNTKSRAIKLFSESKWPGWLGFFLGMVMGFIVTSGNPKTFTTSVAFLAILVCIGFAWYELGTFDGRQQDKVPDKSEKAATPTQDAFQERCDQIVSSNKLTPREKEVLRLLAKGYNADSISKELNIARPTTKTHIQHIYQKLAINSQQALIALFNEQK